MPTYLSTNTKAVFCSWGRSFRKGLVQFSSWHSHTRHRISLTLAKLNTFPGLPKSPVCLCGQPKTYAKHTPEQTLSRKGSCCLHQYDSLLPKTGASSAAHTMTSAIPRKDCSAAYFAVIIPDVNHIFHNKVPLLELQTESLSASALPPARCAEHRFSLVLTTVMLH